MLPVPMHAFDRRLYLLSLPLLAVLACTRGTIPAEVTSPDTAPPERAEPTTGATEVPPPKHERVRFMWESADAGQSGSIRTTLPDGESFSGRFHQITRTTQVEDIDTLHDAWTGDPWRSPRWTWGGAWPYYASSEEFITHYTDRAVAVLTGDRGTMMRCRFTLSDPDRGMSGGGSGECQLSDGQRITAHFEPQ